MKVDNSVKSVGRPANGAPRPASGVAAHPAPSAGDQVALSPFSSHLQATGAAMGSTPAVDVARVSEIKQAIAEGRFKINPERIADGLLDSVKLMLAARR